MGVAPEKVYEEKAESYESIVEDPFGILKGEVEAEGIPEKRRLLTEAVLRQKQEKAQSKVTDAGSKWLDLFNKEKGAKEVRDKEARLLRMKQILEESEDEDYKQQAGEDLMGYLEKVKSHLAAERVVL